MWFTKGLSRIYMMQLVFKCPLKQAQIQTSQNIAVEKQLSTMLSSKAPKVINIGNMVHAKATHVYSSKTEGCCAYRPVFITLWLNGVVMRVEREKGSASHFQLVQFQIWVLSPVLFIPACSH